MPSFGPLSALGFDGGLLDDAELDVDRADLAADFREPAQNHRAANRHKDPDAINVDGAPIRDASIPASRLPIGVKPNTASA